MTYYSQYEQDKFIHQNLLSDTDSKIFIDIGAYDGIEGSNTKFFEESLGWDGICFEPNSNIFARLMQNRKCQCIRGAAWDADEQKIFRMITGYSEMLSGVVDELDPQHINRIDVECQQMHGSYEDVPVQCYNLNKLLIDNNVLDITYLSIDTEGSESRIIQSLDLGTINIKIFSVENNYKDSSVFDYLTSHGYARITRLVIDDIYVKLSR